MSQAVAHGDLAKASRANESVPPTLTAHVGGACSIVHVLEWKEGMAILPSSNLKVGSLSCTDPVLPHNKTMHIHNFPSSPLKSNSGRFTPVLFLSNVLKSLIKIIKMTTGPYV